ncbi:MAG TPA: hypothetical protein QF353_06640 [Gammaproteobacteria bacterium]|nr:hypothetical protein [Gammaproteobacteria bacterium]
MTNILFILNDRSKWLNKILRVLLALTVTAPVFYWHKIQNPELTKRIEDINKSIQSTKEEISSTQQTHAREKTKFILKHSLSKPNEVVETSNTAISKYPEMQMIALDEFLPESAKNNQLIDYSIIDNNIVKVGFELKARTRYNTSYELLKSLEKITTTLYWDSVHYIVYDYPYAVMDLKYFIMNEEEKDNGSY